MAANASNQIGVAGTAPDTELVDCRIFSPDTGQATLGNVLAAIAYSARIGTDVANLSVDATVKRLSQKSRFYFHLFNKVTEYAERHGTLVVAAAGNSGLNLRKNTGTRLLPAEASGVLTVSATGPIGFDHGSSGLEKPFNTPAFYTNYGRGIIDIAAPGGNFSRQFPHDWFYDMVLNTSAFASISNGKIVNTFYGYGWFAGTSMAAPQVSGAAALVKSENPQYNPRQVRETLERSASTDYPGNKAYYGLGVIAPNSALQSADNHNY